MSLGNDCIAPQRGFAQAQLLWKACGIVHGMTMSFWKLGWRTLWRDARAGELRLLWLAVALAVAALTSVAFFANRLEAGLSAMHASCWAVMW